MGNEGLVIQAVRRLLFDSFLGFGGPSQVSVGRGGVRRRVEAVAATRRQGGEQAGQQGDGKSGAHERRFRVEAEDGEAADPGAASGSAGIRSGFVRQRVVVVRWLARG